MKTEVAILHQDYPPGLRTYADSKLQPLERYYDRTFSLRATLERQHDEHRAELVASVGKGVVLVVDERAESIRAALDEAVDRMGRTLRRHKEKLTAKRRVRVKQ